jgi:hypothetical protein
MMRCSGLLANDVTGRFLWISQFHGDGVPRQYEGE